ncbi:hypothetical protein CL629_02800 [bacterium]|nr:hypothetical protein [bacterium]|tara:strand:- start:1328 stop:2419 length:1092 start_codon:yes stop_codon:yes gene_type:complete
MSFTASSISTGMQCPRLYKYKYIDGYRSEPSAAMKTGTMVHLGLETYWNGEDLMTALLNMESLKMGDDWWEEEEGLIAFAKCQAYVNGYYKKWEKDDELHNIFNDAPITIYPELKFEFEHGDLKVRGKFDVLIVNKDTFESVVIEHKTTSLSIDSGGIYFDKLPMDIQCTIYREAAHMLTKKICKDASPVGEFGGKNPCALPLPRVFYDVISTTKSGPKQKTKAMGGKSVVRRKDETDEELVARKEANKETIEEFGQRMVDTYEEDDSPKYVRHEVSATFGQHVLRMIELDEYTTLLSDTRFQKTRNSTACGSYGGCAYLDPCLERGTLQDSPKLVKLDVLHPELDGERARKLSSAISYNQRR